MLRLLALRWDGKFDDLEIDETYQLLIPPSIESNDVCGAKTDIPFADNFNSEACSGFDNLSDLIIKSSSAKVQYI